MSKIENSLENRKFGFGFCDPIVGGIFPMHANNVNEYLSKLNLSNNKNKQSLEDDICLASWEAQSQRWLKTIGARNETENRRNIHTHIHELCTGVEKYRIINCLGFICLHKNTGTCLTNFCSYGVCGFSLFAIISAPTNESQARMLNISVYRR